MHIAPIFRFHCIRLVCLLIIAAWPLAAETDGAATYSTLIPDWRPVNLRLTFAGDIMAHTQNFRDKPYEAIYEGITRLLKDSDLNFANLEFPIDDTAPWATYPLFNVHSEYAWAAILAGFNVFSLANNHSADRGLAGMKQTGLAMKALATKADQELKQTITYNGLKPLAEDPPWDMETISVSGKKIGFVALAEWVNQYRLTKWVQNFDSRRDPAATTLLDWIVSVRSSVDLLVLSYHWGDEYAFVQTKARAEFSRKLVDAGVDIIWGTHPHVLQQWYQLDSARGQALVMPSLGNFISAQSWGVGPAKKGSIDAAKGNSMLFKLGVDFGPDGLISFSELSPVLIANWRNPKGQMVVRTMVDLMATEKGEWLTFWKYRWAIMSDFIKNSDLASQRYGLSVD